jgi:hypothetical protein
MNSQAVPSRSDRWWAAVIGGAGVLGIICLGLFYSVGGVFATLNDLWGLCDPQ